MLTCLYIYFYFISVYLSSICNHSKAAHYWNHSHEEKAGSWSWSLNEPLPSHVVIQFNMSLHNNWKTYTYVYDTDMLGNKLLMQMTIIHMVFNGILRLNNAPRRALIRFCPTDLT